MNNIDSNRFIESLMKHLGRMPLYHWLPETIIQALNDQGLQYDYAKNKIVKKTYSTESKTQDYSIKKDKWYICIKDYNPSGIDPIFIKGNKYLSMKDGYICSDLGFNYPYENIKDYFRPEQENDHDKNILNEILTRRDIDTYISQVVKARNSIPYSYDTFIWKTLADLEDDLIEIKKLKENKI